MLIMSKQTSTDFNLSKLLLPGEAASILGVTSATLAVWRSTGRYSLPYVKSGGKVMYRPADLEAFIKLRTVHGRTTKAIDSGANADIFADI
jgi:DNA-binding transcriptional MerR regulator